MNTRQVGSLRRRLILWLLGPVILVSTVLFVDSYRSAREAADRAYDRVIAASVLAIADRVLMVEGRLDVDLPYVALQMLSTDADDRVFYRIAAPDGALLTGYADLLYRGAGAEQQGSGLGLAIVREVAYRHGGSVALEEGGNGGLLVRVKFPLAGEVSGGPDGEVILDRALRRGLACSHPPGSPGA